MKFYKNLKKINRDILFLFNMYIYCKFNVEIDVYVVYNIGFKLYCMYINLSIKIYFWFLNLIF